MSLRLGALHDALLDPGNAEKAQRAAEELANYEGQLADVRSDLRLLKWMVGAVLGTVLGIVTMILGLYGRLPR
jgi:hypothetical protein